MLNRTKAPPIKGVKNLKFPAPQIHTLDNGAKVYDLRMGDQEVIKLEIVFLAGRPFEKTMLASRAVAALLNEGTTRHTGAELAEKFDFYGSTLSMPYHLDSTNIVLYCLVRHFEPLLILLTEMLTEPVFPEKELQAFIQRNQQRLKIDLSKNDVIAYRKITECIFGEEHPYGYNSFPDSYAALKREDLAAHYRRLYNAGNCFLFISGQTSDRLIHLLNLHLGQAIPRGRRAVYEAPVISRPTEKLRIPHADRIQTAIRIGRRLFNKKHPDFNGLYVLTTILGGHFGSRLMSNIREDKGYTYNIHATIDALIYDGYFYIGAEVGNEFVDDTLREIYREMRRLQKQLASTEEMEMVRNYLMGNFLSMLDGPFNISELLRTMVLEDLPFAEFEKLVETVQSITPKQIRELARKYFNPTDMWEVVVG